MPHTRGTLGLAVLCVSQLVDVLSVNTAVIALPDIRDDLGMSDGDAQWVISACALLFGGLLLPGGWLADRRGGGADPPRGAGAAHRGDLRGAATDPDGDGFLSPARVPFLDRLGGRRPLVSAWTVKGARLAAATGRARHPLGNVDVAP